MIALGCENRSGSPLDNEKHHITYYHIISNHIITLLLCYISTLPHHITSHIITSHLHIATSHHIATSLHCHITYPLHKHISKNRKPYCKRTVKNYPSPPYPSSSPLASFCLLPYVACSTGRTTFLGKLLLLLLLLMMC